MGGELVTELWDQVYPNLIASGICFVVGGIWAHRKVRSLHRSLDSLHTKLRKGPGA